MSQQNVPITGLFDQTTLQISTFYFENFSESKQCLFHKITCPLLNTFHRLGDTIKYLKSYLFKIVLYPIL